jgi:hypothetical protein
MKDESVLSLPASMETINAFVDRVGVPVVIVSEAEGETSMIRLVQERYLLELQLELAMSRAMPGTKVSIKKPSRTL